MPEISTPVHAVWREYVCDLCGVGKMEPVGLYFPPYFPHRCDKCGHKANLDQKYPYVGYEPRAT